MKIKDINTIFNDTKDGKLYTKIITKAKSQNRTRLKKDNKEYIYYEKHHILPKSIYPEYSKLSDNVWNSVLLTAREHFICHLLLVNHYRKIGDRSNWHKMSLAVSKLKCNNKYYNSRLYETVRKSFKHSEETKKRISQSREKNSKLLYIYDKNGILVEEIKSLFAYRKYPHSLFKSSIDNFFGYNFNSRQKLRKNGNSKYIGWFVSDIYLHLDSIKKKIDNNLEKINSDFKDIYVYKLNSLVEIIKYNKFIKKYSNSILKATKEHPIGHTRESQLSLKNKNLENNIGLWCSDKEEDLKNIKFEQFGEVYSENKRKYNIYCYGELIYTNLTEPDIARKLPNIKYALRKTSREQPLGHGAGRQTSWLIERGLINKYKGYFKEII